MRTLGPYPSFVKTDDAIYDEVNKISYAIIDWVRLGILK